jgi:hypothetical protein
MIGIPISPRKPSITAGDAAETIHRQSRSISIPQRAGDRFLASNAKNRVLGFGR